MLAAQRDEAELALAREGFECGAGVDGQRRLATPVVLGGVELARRGIELLGDNDPVSGELDAFPSQRIELTRPQTRECGHLQPGRKGRTREPMSALDDPRAFVSLGGC
jgi:hypothetical protein